MNPIKITINEIRENLPELPDVKKARYLSEFGLTDYSGHISYEYHFTSDSEYDAVLDLGTVCNIAKIWINNESISELLWRPYRTDIHIQKGDNVIQIKVCNTLANELTETKAPSGLLGPVKIITKNISN